VAVANLRFTPSVRSQLNPRGEIEVTDAEYVGFIRRFPPSKLVSLVAAVASDYAFNQADYSTNSLITPWGLADVARVSLAFGNEHRPAEPTMQDLLKCLQMHNNLGHPASPLKSPARPSTRFCSWRSTSSRSNGRRHTSLDEVSPSSNRPPFLTPMDIEVMHDGWQTDLLGCNLSQYTGVTQLLAAAAQPNGGRFDPAWIERADLKELTDIFEPAITRRMLTQHLAAPASSFRQRDPERPSIRRRFTFNPLVVSPVVSGLGPDLLVPVPDFVMWKPTPSGLYFTGLGRWVEAFTRDLGKLFQAYVGRHLALISSATLYPEIEYKEGNRNKSIDWILIFPELVLLVEVKVGRPKQAVQSGAEGAAEGLRAAFDKAFKQLDITYELIQARRPEFGHIPADRPILGIVVTLEDFHVVNSPLHQPLCTRSKKLPTLAVPVEELEGIVCLGPDTARFLLDNITETVHNANLRLALSHQNVPLNPHLDRRLGCHPNQPR
jgi:hypothetical protein